ncbi:FecR family protein [Pedobacter hartonius]|uniref:FecR family protein n=1 Tax=Pedobacter hartonius TaxID=425514 RepID=A0A1H4DX08_9SPHI|nr:FecR domain-containing protein [Pedobacter hartonius]SEA77271.1 FecR family protein [Pedobacter hartonius]
MKLNQEEISQLVYERFTGTISEEDNAYLDQALATNEEYRQLYEQIIAGLQAQKIDALVRDIDEESAWKRVKTQLDSPPEHRTYPLMKRVLSYAAVALLALSAGLYIFHLKSAKEPQLLAANPNRIQLQLASGEKVNIDSSAKVIYAGNVKLNASTKLLSFKSTASKSTALNLLVIPKTVTYRVILADGTAIMLNSSSKLRFPLNFGGPNREVYLEGEAYFEVAKNPKRPFIVHTPLTDIKVLGTTFNVSAYGPSAVTTSLIEGSVSTSAKNKKEFKLKPGMQAVYSSGRGFSRNTFQTEEVVSWMKGVYNFHATPLQDIAPIVERWFDVKVHFASSSVAALKFTGIIDKGQSLQVFLHNLKATADINAVVEQGQMTFSGP